MITASEKEALQHNIDGSYKEMMAALAAIAPEDVNKIPYEDGWTAGQVVDHIIKSTASLADSETKEADRPYDQQVATLEKIFLDLDRKLDSPGFILPGDGPFSQDQLLETLDNIRKSHLESIDTKDLTRISVSFKMPTIGHLSLFELLRFFAVHTKRHTFQLEKIKKALSE